MMTVRRANILSTSYVSGAIGSTAPECPCLVVITTFRRGFAIHIFTDENFEGREPAWLAQCRTVRARRS